MQRKGQKRWRSRALSTGIELRTPPLSGADGAGTISTTTLNNLCYQYQYDLRDRPMAKKLPGKGWEYTVYNNMDQPIGTQDSLQRAANEWIFTKYDGLGRVAITGIWNNGGVAISQATLQTELNSVITNLYETAQTTGNGYTDVAQPTSNITTTLSINFYDSYSTMPGMPAAFTAPTGAALNTIQARECRAKAQRGCFSCSETDSQTCLPARRCLRWPYIRYPNQQSI